MTKQTVRTYDEVRGGMHAAGRARRRRRRSSPLPLLPSPLHASTGLPSARRPGPPQEMAFIEQLSPYHYKVRTGFVPGMNVPGVFYVNDRLRGLLFEELQAYCQRGEHGGFLPAVKQIANVAALPGIVRVRQAAQVAAVVADL